MATTNWFDLAREEKFRVRNFINGRYVDCIGEDKITKFSPRDGSFLYEFLCGTGQEVDEAVAVAKKSFSDGRWSGLSVHIRKNILQNLIGLIENNFDKFALYESLDVGKPIGNSLGEDIPVALMLLKSYVENADKLKSFCGNDGAAVSYQLRKPVGVVGAIVGWNYPFMMAVMKMGPALAMGNSIVLKPSEFSSLSAVFLATLAQEAGVPAGVFNVVHGAGSIVGAKLSQHADIDLLSFTGSSATGKEIMVSAGRSNMKRLMLECGGKSPYIIFDDCDDDLDFIAADIVDTGFHNQGEFCSAGTRVLIQEGLKERLLPKIVQQAAKLIPNDPLDLETNFGALINEDHMNKVLAYIESGKQEGATVICGGGRAYVNSEASPTQGYYIEPTIFDNVSPHHKIAQEEIFGPVLSILTFKDEEEAISIANNSAYGLVAYVATRSFRRSQRMARSINCGHLYVVGSSNLAGGRVEMASEPQKQSGFGCEIGVEGLASYTVGTSVHVVTE